jgi:hypothetical protein
LAFLGLPAWGQTEDANRNLPPFTVEALYAAANQTHPLLQAARLEAQAGTIDVAAIERQRWPTLSAVVESNTGNASSLPSHSLRVQQIVWDAGLVSSRVTEAENQVTISKLRVQLQQRQIYLQISNAWQSMWAAHALDYDVILAHQMNGTTLTAKNKGPLFIVYPYDSKPELQTVRFYERSIWQLKSLQVE